MIRGVVIYYHASNSREWEALQLHAVHKNLYFVLQVTRESVLQVKYYVQVTLTVSECAINHCHHSTKLYQKKYHLFVSIGILSHAVHS